MKVGGLYHALMQQKRAFLASSVLIFALVYHSHASGQSEDLASGLTVVYGKPPSPQLDLQGLEGKRYRLSDYEGSVVLVNFWATWCAPCVHEMPTLQTLRDTLKGQRFEILAINFGEEEKKIQAFLEKFKPKLEFPILLAQDQSIVQEWKIQALPTSYIIDSQGRWVYQALGPRDFTHPHIVGRIQDLLDE